MDEIDPKLAGFSREDLIAAIKEGEGQYGKRELARALGLKAGDQKRHLKDALAALEDDGVISRDAKRNYLVAGALPAVTVVMITDRDNDGELLAEPVRSDRSAPIIRLAPGEGAGGAGQTALGIGDKALVRLAAQDDGTYEARLIKRLGQSAHRILCVMRKPEKGYARLLPVDRRTRHELIPAKGESEKAKDGELVLCAIAKERRFGLKTAEIVEVLGDAESAGAGSVIALHAHGVPQGFSETELRETKAIKPAKMGQREDLRALPLITIDPDDAKDHDDAVWAAEDTDEANPGGFIVIVAIADVAAYIEAGGALDRGAYKRGNSVYLPDRVVPMLPERLSNDLCSLRENEERPCMAVRMVFDKNGHKRSHRFIRGWMKSAAKLAYTQAQNAIDGKGDDKAGPLLEAVLKPLWGAYAALSKARADREPLEIDAPERRVRVDENGQVTGIELRERFDAHKLIEEMMIQANVCAAESLEKKRTPLIYRVHEESSREKIDALADYLPTVGFKWTRGERVTTARFNKLLKQARASEHYETINEVVLRSQSQAIYSIENAGHFGLNLDHYAHFTSPIRRYADLTVHRALIRALDLGDDGQSDEERSRLDTIAEEITHSERRAMAAERDAVDRFVALYLADKVGAEFEGRITGVTRFGAFIRLHETGADGLVPMSDLGEERYMHDESAHALIGESTGGRYRLGMSVRVRIEEATPITGGLLLSMVTDPEPGPRPSRRARSGKRPGHAQKRGGRPWKKGKRR